MEPPTRDIIVSTPAGSDFVHVLRAVLASLAARRDFPYDSIEDLKLAVDEASAHLLRAAPDARMLLVRVGMDGDGLVVSVIADGGPEGPRVVEAEAPSATSLSWEILKALTDDASFEIGPEGPMIRFTLHPR